MASYPSTSDPGRPETGTEYLDGGTPSADGVPGAGVVECKRCGGPKIVRYGSTRRGKQRLRCRTCGATFLDNSAPPRMRFSAEVIAAALEAFYGGATLKEIAEALTLHHDVTPNYANIHRWIVRYSGAAVKALADLTPSVGGVWLVAESEVESRASGGRPAWSWDVFDQRTSYLLCSAFSTRRSQGGHRQALQEAERRAGRRPDDVEFGSWTRASLTGVWTSRAVPGGGATDSPLPTDDRPGRVRVGGTVHRFAPRILELVVEGWRVDYNLFRPQIELAGITPAEAAGVTGRLGGWEGVVAIA